MKISKQAKRDAKSLFKACVVDGLMNEDRAREVVTKVLGAKPRGYLAILQHFQRLLKLDIDKRTAKVESAVGMSDDQKNALKNNLETKYGAGLNLTFSVNAALIGGLRIQIGSDVYDGSVQVRLAQLKNGAAL